MSRSLGLREDQRFGDVLAARIAELFALDPLKPRFGSARACPDRHRPARRSND